MRLPGGVPAGTPWDQARPVVERLAAAGFETLVAGGAVRDLLLRRPVQDIDLATAASPDDVAGLFPRTIAVGRQFGVMVVLLEGGGQVEVASFRSDGIYVDGRRPVGVSAASRSEDVARRDFTVNALLLDLGTGTVIDEVGGLADLADRRLRAVGDPWRRLAEDRLRVLRGLRFAAVLGFALEPGLAEAMAGTDPAGVSRERVVAELGKALAAGGGAGFCRLAAACGRLDGITPGLDPEATATLVARLDSAPAITRLAGWLHTLGPAGAAAWLATQPVPAAWRRDAPWLIDQAARLPGAGLVERRRALRDPRAPALAALAGAWHPSLTGNLPVWLAQEQAAGPCPVRPADVLAAGISSGPEVGRICRRAESLWLEGVSGDPQTLIRRACSMHEPPHA